MKLCRSPDDALMKNASPASPSRSIVVLIEDDNRVATALAMLIEDWGYECIAVRTPEAAAERLGPRLAEAVALVVDLSRNDAFTGRRSGEAINAALGSTLPRIITTNEPGLARAHGYADVLAKPYEPEALQLWLAAQVARRASASSPGVKAG